MDAHTPATQPTRQAIEAIDRSAPGKVTGKLKRALEYMFEGKSRKEAAALAGYNDESLRQALKRPHVRRYYLDELEVLRTGERVRNFLALCEVRDQRDNQMARVQAIKTLEGEADQALAAASQRQSPGVTIVFNHAPPVGQVVGREPETLDLPAISTTDGG